jgi:hypothetical protein
MLLNNKPNNKILKVRLKKNATPQQLNNKPNKILKVQLKKKATPQQKIPLPKIKGKAKGHFLLMTLEDPPANGQADLKKTRIHCFHYFFIS